MKGMRRGGAPGRRVGELDEEMVYETRWATSSPWAPRVGGSSRSPTTRYWSPPRRALLDDCLLEGRCTRSAAGAGARVRHFRPRGGRHAAGGCPSSTARSRTGRICRQQLGLLSGRAAGSHRALPTDQTVVFERFRDELGDWRVCVHCPLGTGVLSPWALAVEHAARERYGMDVQATATNDGMVLRIPDTESEPPSAELIVCDPELIESVISDEVGSSALFAARFRENAARALLLPRRDPRLRSPLWQQRMRSAQLLTVAAVSGVSDRARDHAGMPERRLRSRGPA